MQLFKQPPQAFYVVVFVGNVGVLHIHPIAHFLGKVFPNALKRHHVLAAGGVVVGYRNLSADVVFGDAQFFFHLQFYGQPVRIPAAFAVYLLAQQGLVAAKKGLLSFGSSRGVCLAFRLPRADLRKIRNFLCLLGCLCFFQKSDF